jgi:hypothetical protein
MRRTQGGIVALIACLGLASAPSSRAQPWRGVVLERVTRIAHRADGDPYELDRWTLPLDRTDIEVADAGMGRDFERWVREGASLVINGGFYGTDRRPEGLVIAQGRERSAFLARIGGGVLAVTDGRAQLFDAEADPLGLPDRSDFAIQCRPRLVVDGRNNIRRPTRQTAARTALCIRDGGRRLDVYLARREPSRGRAGPNLYTLAAELVREGCEHALNLDGGPSTGAAWRTQRGVESLPPRRGVRHAIVFRVHPAR